MGILAPLYLAGLAALSLPLILHLVRRTPRGRQVFSSLMFLTPSPPRLTRRSRLDQLLLLALRLTALALLVMAFTRPFLRAAATLSFSDVPSRRVAIMVDTSASMRRGDLWQQAITTVERELEELAPHDEIALYAFDSRLKTIAEFEEDATTDSTAARRDLLRQQLRKLRPGWGATDLGTALTTVASELDAASDARQSAAEPHIVLVSDLQKGSRTESLATYEWPPRVRVTAHQLTPKGTTNAFAQLLTSEEETAASELRVRIVNAADSEKDQFFVRWSSPSTSRTAVSAKETETAVYVPPGQSRVLKLPRPETSKALDRIALRGDDHEFDNVFYVVPPLQQNVRLVYGGNDAADDPQGLQYYLRLATAGDPLRRVTFQMLEGEDFTMLAADSPPQLVVISRAVSTGVQAALKAYVERGGSLILAPQDGEAATLLRSLLDDVELVANPAKRGEYLLLGEIDFDHPLFAPFAGPQYSDFTKVHFWKHRPLRLKSPATTRIVAQFDNGDPAILERTMGDGRLLVFASGWQPEESQLALSSKFVPLVGAILDQACGGGEILASVAVDEPVPLRAGMHKSPLAVVKPDGKKVELAADSTSFTQNDQPGIYRAGTAADAQRFAVNLAATESNTTPLAMDQLEQLGVKLGTSVTRAERLNRIRQQRDTELESRQKIWRWLVVAAICGLIAETWWAGRAAQQLRSPSTGARTQMIDSGEMAA